MGKYLIKGGKKLNGEVEISGAKNATLGILAATILCDEEVVIENVPNVRDTKIMIDALIELGAEVKYINRNIISINAKNVTKHELSQDEFNHLRASYYFVGSLLGRHKKAKVILPGGCDIGARPINLHLKGFNALGANCEIKDGYINAEASNLRGANIYLDIVSVGATINIMLASVLSEGTTIIENVAKEPHVVDIANFLNSMGANVKGAGTDTIRIKGVKKLHSSNYAIIPDQIEAGTYMTLAAITGGDITIKNVIPKHLESITAKLLDMGNNVIVYDEAVRVIGADRQLPTSIKTMPYPGFPTDLQPQISCTLSIANGESIITESIFENRFKYVSEIKKMGAIIEVNGSILNITGVEKLKGANLVAPDLRAGAALVLAALSAEGESIVDNVEFIERGYENFIEKLKDLNADINSIK